MLKKSDKYSGWIGVDLDGTLAEYRGWNNGEIGPPIPAMVERVKRWIEWTDTGHDGPEIKIFTARVCRSLRWVNEEERQEALDQERRIEQWCLLHIGRKLPITCIKDFAMITLWDDRCVQVVPNTGQRADGRTDGMFS